MQLKERHQQHNSKTELLIYLPQTLQAYQPSSTNGGSDGNQQTVIDLRLFVEDLDLFHVDASKYETYFGATMTRDFFDPLDIIGI